MPTIIAPVNFTANSTNAARYAADMAVATHADLHLIHILQMPVSVAEFPLTDYVFEEMHKSAIAALKELWQELVHRTGGKVNVFTNLEAGPIAYKLELFCQEKKPLFVVMGASGNTFERVFAASNTAIAIRHLPYPLIIVPESAIFHTIRKVLLACDVDDLSSGIHVPDSLFKQLSTYFDARFEVININTKKEQAAADAVFQEGFWRTHLREFFPDIHFIHNDTVKDGIDQFIAGYEADVLMVFPKKHGLLEFHSSQAKKIAAHCPVPVMSVHA